MHSRPIRCVPRTASLSQTQNLTLPLSNFLTLPLSHSPTNTTTHPVRPGLPHPHALERRTVDASVGNRWSLQGYLAYKKTRPSQDPTVGLYLGSYGGPRGGGWRPGSRDTNVRGGCESAGRSHARPFVGAFQGRSWNDWVDLIATN